MKRVVGVLSILLLFYTICSPAVMAEQADQSNQADQAEQADQAGSGDAAEQTDQPGSADASDKADPAQASDKADSAEAADEAGHSSDRFADLKELPSAAKDKLDALIDAGIFNGLAADRFGPELDMNRAQMAKVAALAFELPVDDRLKTSGFSDVSRDDPASGYALPYIEALKTAGLTNGYDAEGTRYNPGGPVSRQELAAFLIRGLGLEDAAGQLEPVDDPTVAEWARQDVALALDNKLMAAGEDGKGFEGARPATRLELALAAYEARSLFLDGRKTEGGKVSLLEAVPAGAIKVSVRLSRDVDPEKAKLEVTKDGEELSGDTEWAEDRKSAAIELDDKLVEGKYTVKLTGLDEDAVDRSEADFMAEDERLETLRFESSSDILPQSKVTVAFRAENQYGETSDWTANDFRIQVGPTNLTPVPLAGKQAFLLDLTGEKKGMPISVFLFREPMTENSEPVSRLFTVGDPPIVMKVEPGELKFQGSDTALKPGGRAYLPFAAYDQYGFRIGDSDILTGEWGVDVIFSEPGVFSDKPSAGKLFDYDGDGYPDISLEVSPDVKQAKEVSLMMVSTIYGIEASVKLKIVPARMPASFEFDFSDTLTVGDEDEYVPIIVKDGEGKELSPSEVIEAETAGLIQVMGSGQLVLEADPPTRTDYSVTPNVVRKTAIQATGSDRGKIRIARVLGGGQGFVNVFLPFANKNVQLTIDIEQPQEKKPVSVVLDGDSASLLLAGTEHQVKFKVLDQYGGQFNASLPDYKVEYKLERTGGETGAITTGGAAELSDGHATVRREISDSSGKGVTFVADPTKAGAYRLSVSLIRVSASGAVLGKLSTASATAEVFGGGQELTYEMDVDDTLFAAGQYEYSHGKIPTAVDATYLLKHRDAFAKEIEISAKDELGRKVALPSDIIRTIGASDPDLLGDDDEERIVGLNAGKATVTVIFDTPTGARTLSKEVEIKADRPVIQELKVDKSANVVDSAVLNGLKPWDGQLMKKVSIKDQYDDSFANDEIAEYNDLFGVAFLIGDIHYRPNTPAGARDSLFIDSAGNIVYAPGSGNAGDNNIADFTLTAVTPGGKTYSTFVSVQ